MFRRLPFAMPLLALLRAVPAGRAAGAADSRAPAPRFPAEWGPPPAAQTRDYRELPGGYGFGSSTLAKWIQEDLDGGGEASLGRPPADADDEWLIIVRKP